MADENVHKHHRARLRKKYFNNGMDVLEDHEVIELLLFYVMRIRNVNETGHNICNRFEKLYRVFEAEESELMSIDGVGRSMAELLRFEGELMQVYEQRRNGGEHRFMREEGMNMIYSLFEDAPSEPRLYMILLGRCDRIISTVLLAKGEFSFADIDMKYVLSAAMRLDALRVIFVHNHIDGNVLPSDTDIAFTKLAQRAFEYIDVEMNDHIVVTGRTAVSIKNDMRALN